MRITKDSIKKLEKAIKFYHTKHNNWPFGKKVFIPFYPQDDCPFPGPGVEYKCDMTRKRIRIISMDATLNINEFINKLKK